MKAFGLRSLLVVLAISGCTSNEPEQPDGVKAADASPVAARCTNEMLNLYYSPPATRYSVFRERIPVVAKDLPADCASNAEACATTVLRAALAYEQPRGRREGEKAFATSDACTREGTTTTEVVQVCEEYTLAVTRRAGAVRIQP